MRRLFCESIPDVGGLAELSKEETKHLRTVLRGAGGEIELLDGRGLRASATLEQAPNKRSAFARVTMRSQEAEPALKLCLYVAPPRSKIMGQLIRQATELGVWGIHPIITERSVATPVGESAAWTVQAQEALKQSGNPWLPTFHAPIPFAEAIKIAPRGWCGAPAHLQACPTTAPSDERQAVWIGPEGGFSPSESLTLSQVTTPISIGSHVLRIETAAIAVLAAVYCLNGTTK